MNNVSNAKYDEYLEGYENVYINYQNLLNPGIVNSKSKGFVPVKVGQGYIDKNPTKGKTFGPELGMAEYFSRIFPNSDTYIIKFGATTTKDVAGRWDVNYGTYYLDMMEFFEDSINELIAMGVDFEIVSFCLLDGSSDAYSGYTAFEDNFEALVDNVLTKYTDYSHESGISFLSVSTSRFYNNHWRIDEIKEAFCKTDEKYYFIDTFDIGLTRNEDGMVRKYFDAMSELKLGNILAKKIDESLDYQLKVTDELDISKYEIKDYVLRNGLPLESVADGKKASSLWNIKNENGKIFVNVQVLDEYITNGDGIELIVTECGRNKTFVDGSTKVKISVDGTCELRTSSKGTFKWSHSDDLVPNVKIIKMYGLESGYNISFELDNIFGENCAYSLALINKNVNTNKKVYSELGTNEEVPYSFMTLENGHLIESIYEQYGMTFGNAPTLISKDVWNIENDDNSNDRVVSMTGVSGDNELYMYQSNDLYLYAEAAITARDVYNFDIYPKFGIKVVTEQNSGIFFYVYADGNGTDMRGTYLGYVTFTNGVYNDDWIVISQFTTDCNSYQNGNYVRLAVLREKDVYTFYCNGNPVHVMDNVSTIGSANAYMAIASFNVTLTVKDYSLIYGEELEEFLK